MITPLILLEEGEKAEIISYSGRHAGRHGYGHGHGHGCNVYHGHEHLINMGLRPGKRIEMISNRGTGPIVVRMDESRIALGRGMAMKIYVRRNG